MDRDKAVSRGRKTHRVILGLLLIVTLLGCDSGSSSGPTAPRNVSLAGTWDALIAGSRSQQIYSAVATFSQSGSQVSGTFVSSQGQGGQLSGQVIGQAFQFNLTAGLPCPSSYNGTATIEAGDRSMRGSYGGQDCLGGFQANFTAQRR